MWLYFNGLQATVYPKAVRTVTTYFPHHRK